ncbi:hypothetical protein ACI7RC_23025 [Brevibacillus sp. B_LB10_24]|uniref:hypothetical protein n=1 Tax=Brevibacillus sp. B_LB10_24 TaxID=3380645 RepID=UPI0038B9627F
MSKKYKKKADASAPNRSSSRMKIVTSETCKVCPTPCQRGLRYLEKMSEPGAIGFGVPCILTKGK